MKKLNILITLLFSLQLMSQSNVKVLTFEQALIQMNNSNLALKSAAAEKKANEYKRKTTRGLYLPRISFSASYFKLDQDIGLDISGFTDAYREAANIPASKMLPSSLVLQQEEFAAANINFVWPIFNGGKIRAVNRAMDANINEAQYKIEQKQNELNTELVQRYYGDRLAKKAVELYQNAYDAMVLHQHNAEKLHESGMISKAQLLYANISVSQAETDLQSAINKANTVSNALKNTLADSSDIDAVSELFLIKNIENIEYFQQAARENNPLLKQVEAKKNLAKQNFNIKKAGYFPSIAIVGNKELAQYQLTQLMPEWFIGVNFRWTIFHGAARTFKTKAAKATIDRVNFIETKAIADISTYITKLHNELQSYIKQLETMKTTYNFAKEYLRVQQKAFAEGFATSKDLVDAELTLNKVKVGRLKIMNDYVYTLAKLLEFSGKSEMFLEYSKREDREKEEFE
jgi:outer membrane protein TolC